MVLMYVNAWFLYCRDATEEDQISFLNFSIGIVQGFLKADKTSTTVIHEAERPSTSSLEKRYKEKCNKGWQPQSKHLMYDWINWSFPYV
jgi:hypothetical protein